MVIKCAAIFFQFFIVLSTTDDKSLWKHKREPGDMVT